MSVLKRKAVLMRLSIGLPGETRGDKDLTASVKSEHGLGFNAGKWLKQLFPTEALQDIKKLDNQARAYHAAVTLPFDNGVGILPAALICEYGDRMRTLVGQRDVLIESFLSNPQRWIDWAMNEHNGSFNPDLYPGCHKQCLPGEPERYVVDEAMWAQDMRDKFNFKTEPLPVPDSEHFETNVKDLLGIDTNSVDKRVEDATKEAQREILKRMIEPVKHMAAKLKEDAPRIFKTLVSNIDDIAKLAPKLNLTGDPEIDRLAGELSQLTSVSVEGLKDNASTRNDVRVKAEEVLERLSGYQL